MTNPYLTIFYYYLFYYFLIFSKLFSPKLQYHVIIVIIPSMQINTLYTAHMASLQRDSVATLALHVSVLQGECKPQIYCCNAAKRRERILSETSQS